MRIVGESRGDNLIAAHADILYDNSGPRTLAEHLWILSKLLVMKGQPAKVLDRLIRYLIATCYPKMDRRWKHQTLSKPHIDSLNQVKDEDVTFNESLRGQPSVEAIASDRLFLADIMWLVEEPSTPIPRILEQAKLAAANEDFQLYNENTCKEFHSLFLDILKRFETSLSDLTLPASARTHEQFQQSVKKVLLAGVGLQKLTAGAALPMHLRTIEAKLDDPRRADMSMPRPRRNADKDGEQGEEQDELDEELQAVQPSAIRVKENKPDPVPLWKSYRNWLKLMVIYFDSANTLVNYVGRPTFHQQRLSLQILAAPSTDKALLPWQELFTDSTLFPTGNEADSTTNDEILEFLNFAADSNTKQCLPHIKAVRKSWANGKKDATVQHLGTLDKILLQSKTAGWHTGARKLVTTIRNYYAAPSTDKCDELSKITCTIESLCDSGNFFASLSEANVFTSTMHCEACLASLLPHHSGNDVTIDSKQHEAVLAQMKVCYVASGWFYQQIINSDDRILDELLAYQNAAARRVDTSSGS